MHLVCSPSAFSKVHCFFFSFIYSLFDYNELSIISLYNHDFRSNKYTVISLFSGFALTSSVAFQYAAYGGGCPTQTCELKKKL